MNRSRLAAATIILVAAAAVFTACTPRQVAAYLAAHLAAATAPVDSRTPVGDGYIFRNDPPDVMCAPLTNSPGATPLPCRSIIDVCVHRPDIDTYTVRWLTEAYTCDASSPTWRTVCATRPPNEWSFYGYTCGDPAPTISVSASLP